MSRATQLRALVVIGSALALAACKIPERPRGMMMADAPIVPAVIGYYEGEEVAFIHTEASDPAVAKRLTEMMESPVLVVPSLARVPEEALANVYVFQSGVEGKGPFGFQRDIFDAPPGSPSYTPLRRLNLVNWVRPEAARELKTLAELRQAESRGEIRIEQPGIVVNMPFLTWPGGER